MMSEEDSSMLIATVEKKINERLSDSDVEIVDESQQHIEHGSEGAHLVVTVVSSQFAGKSMIEQHRMIYDILKEEMKEQIHALRIIAKVK